MKRKRIIEKITTIFFFFSFNWSLSYATIGDIAPRGSPDNIVNVGDLVITV